MLKAVIFDVDGTLLDTERIYMHAWREAGKLHGFTVTESALQRTRAVDRKIAEKIFQEECGEGFDYEKIRPDRVRIAEELIEEESPILMKGAVELLDFLEEKGIKMAVASSTALEKTKSHLALSGIEDRFSVFICGDMVKCSKPNPEIFLRAAEELGENPADCIVIEDSNAGIEAARRAGMRSVLIPDQAPPSEETKANAFAIKESLLEVPAIIEVLLK